MLWLDLIFVLLAAQCLSARGASAAIVDDNSIGSITTIAGPCLEGIIFSFRNGSSVIYGQGSMAEGGTHTMLSKAETLSAVEWSPGLNGCCGDKLGASFVFETTLGRRVLATSSGCSDGEKSRFKLHHSSEHIVGLKFSNSTLVNIQAASLCRAGNLCFMQGYDCLRQVRQLCMSSEGAQREKGFVTTLMHQGVPQCCHTCEQGKYANVADTADGRCEICPLFHSPASDQSECKINGLNIVLLCLAVLFVLWICGGHLILGCPPFWLLALDGCCPRRILAARLFPKYYFTCECKHPDHQDKHSSSSFSSVYPADPNVFCGPQPHGWVFLARQQPGVNGIARCMACTRQHDEWCVNLKLFEEEQREAELESKLNRHVTCQLDVVAKDARHELHTHSIGHSEELSQQEEVTQFLMSTLEESAAAHRSMCESFEERLQNQASDAKEKWKSQRNENKEAQLQHTKLWAQLTKGQQISESLEKKLQAHEQEMREELETSQAEMEASLSRQMGAHEALQDQFEALLQETEDSSEAPADGQAHNSLMPLEDVKLRARLSQVRTEFEAQRSDHSELTDMHTQLEESASKQLRSHEALQEELHRHLADISAEFSAQQKESKKMQLHNVSALEASAAKQYSLHEALAEGAKDYERDTRNRFEAQSSEAVANQQYHSRNMEAFERKFLGKQAALHSELQAFAEKTQQRFDAHMTETGEVHDHHTAALQAAESRQLSLHEELQQGLHAQSLRMYVEFEGQQAENREVQRQSSASEMKASRQFGRHEHLTSEVKALQTHLGIVHKNFQDEHSQHQEVQQVLHTSMKTEHDEALASQFSSNAALESFRGSTTDHIRKHDLALQRLYNEVGPASEKLSKQQMSIERIYAELGIPQNTMPTSWGSPQHIMSKSPQGSNFGDSTRRSPASPDFSSR